MPHRFLEILSGPNRAEFKNGSGRLELAQAIAARTNPLTARVMVNRIWLHHFGEGFVTTPDDFGTMSGAPSHPELLDYLALRFMQSGWSIKTMHKLIMMSAVYQETSETNEAFAKVDPDNRLLWRANIRRLEFEPLRDSLLYIAGKLDLKLGGQPVNILSEPYSQRRSVYGYIDRRDLPEMMNHFDFANPGLPLGQTPRDHGAAAGALHDEQRADGRCGPQAPRPARDGAGARRFAARACPLLDDLPAPAEAGGDRARPRLPRRRRPAARPERATARHEHEPRPGGDDRRAE